MTTPADADRAGEPPLGAPRLGGRERAEPGRRRWPALALLCLTGFIVILDAQVVLVALPSIEEDIGASAAGGWALSGYLLAFGGLLLFGGRLGDLWGRRRVLVLGAAVFGVSSLLCGLAWAPGVLVGARVLQGVSAALMAPAALAILVDLFPEGPERNKALACWSAVGGIGATAALLIGGPVTQTLGWEWIFYLNVPVALAMVVAAPVLLPESRDPNAAGYDPVGAVTVTAGLALLTGAISAAPDSGWVSLRVLGPLLGAVLLLGLFVAVERRTAAPLLPLTIFRSRLFTGGNLLMLFFAMATVGMSVTLTGYTQQVLGYTPLQFGLGLVAMTLLTLVGAWAAHRAISRAGFRVVAAAAAALMGTTLLLLARAPADGSYVTDLLPGLLLFGLGLGAGPVAAIAAALSTIPAGVTGVASGAANATFQIGGALGAAAVTAAASLTAGPPGQEALLAGSYQAGFVTALLAALAALAAALLLLRAPEPSREPPPPEQASDPPG